ncbi:hypothetical protein A464_2646 [Salmonella bongori N268-08]|uniref:Uncharacterized protein n=1 Tax=Salmonella bongori N268-08 TaxID=1197719 RepID=S5MSY5_SALBN|nr:hypothetical protein A464_2646 [Salmonella bongori N268-08]
MGFCAILNRTASSEEKKAAQQGGLLAYLLSTLSVTGAELSW